MKGVHKEMIKSKQPTQFIRKARIAQGIQDFKALDEKQRLIEEGKCEKAWDVVRDVLKEQEGVKSEGVREKVRFYREKRRLIREGKFESVGNAAAALQEWRREKVLKGLR